VSADFVVHPDGTVDYPDTGCYTMSAEEFAAADTRQAWSQAEPPPEPLPYYYYYYEPPHHEPPHHDWMRGPANTSRVCGRGVALLTRPKPKTRQRKSVDLQGPSL
jgi:hypothetical protein